MAIADTTPETVYAATRNGVYVRPSPYADWRLASAGLTDPDVRVLAAALGSPATLFAGTPDGALQGIPCADGGERPLRDRCGADGNLWFTERAGNRIGRITPGGVITEFPLPSAGSEPDGITAGPDGNLWFTERGGNRVGRITTSGTITAEFLNPLAGSPRGITSGPDGNLWLADAAGRVVRVTPAGAFTSFELGQFCAPFIGCVGISTESIAAGSSRPSLVRRKSRCPKGSAGSRRAARGAGSSFCRHRGAFR